MGNTGGTVHAGVPEGVQAEAEEAKKVAEGEEIIKNLPPELKAEIAKIKALPESDREAAFIKLISDQQKNADPEDKTVPARRKLPVGQSYDDEDEDEPATKDEGLSGWAWAGIIAGSCAVAAILAWLVCSWTSADDAVVAS